MRSMEHEAIEAFRNLKSVDDVLLKLKAGEDFNLKLFGHEYNVNDLNIRRYALVIFENQRENIIHHARQIGLLID